MLELSEPLNVWLEVRDLGAAKRFYAEVLGLPLWREEPGEALHFGAGTSVLSVHATEASNGPPRGAWLVFTVGSNVDLVCRELASRGVTFEKPLDDRPFGRSAMLRDPEGHELWIVRPSEAETQFYRWRQSHRQHQRRIPVQRRPKVRRHEREPVSRRRAHPSE
jgi:predicted enzyme related to lactoylglutathione lyase